MAKRTYDFPRPAVTVDVALFQAIDSRLEVLLVRRDVEPFRGRWALPGGFVRESEDLPAAARRELEEETGLTGASLRQLAAVGTPGRDPRGQTVTVVYVALQRPSGVTPRGGGDAADSKWWDVAKLPPLAFDHAVLLDAALTNLRERLGETPVCFELLPERFALGEFQGLCEVILGRPLDPRNFRRRVVELGIVVPTKETRRGGAHRPAQLFRFDAKGFAAHRAKQRTLPF